MSRPLAGSRVRRRGRQVSEGNSNCRSIFPAAILITCTIAVVYGNTSFYSLSLYGPRKSADRPSGTSPIVTKKVKLHQTPSPFLGEASQQKLDKADGTVSPHVKFPSKEALPEPEGPPDIATFIEGTVAPREGVEGEVQWDNQSAEGGESDAFSIWDPQSDNKALEGEGGGEEGSTGGSELLDEREEDNTEERKGVVEESHVEGEGDRQQGGNGTSTGLVKDTGGEEEEHEQNREEEGLGEAVDVERVDGVSASFTLTTSSEKSAVREEGGSEQGGGSETAGQEGGGNATALNESEGADKKDAERERGSSTADIVDQQSGEGGGKGDGGGSDGGDGEGGGEALEAAKEHSKAVNVLLSVKSSTTSLSNNDELKREQDRSKEENPSIEGESGKGETEADAVEEKGSATATSRPMASTVGRGDLHRKVFRKDPDGGVTGGGDGGGDANVSPEENREAERQEERSEGAKQGDAKSVTEEEKTRQGENNNAGKAEVFSKNENVEPLSLSHSKLPFQKANQKNTPSVSESSSVLDENVLSWVNKNSEGGRENMEKTGTRGAGGNGFGQDWRVQPMSMHPAENGEVVKNGAVQGSLDCSAIKLGEGAENIKNIATWKVVPGDGEYRGPLYQDAVAKNGTQYVTLDKDLGGFNNIRMSIECGVAFAAATGRTFVIPPPFLIWNMNTDVPKKEVDLEDLFSLKKLRDSGRVKVITTEEFFEKEALTGNLGILPSGKNLQPKAEPWRSKAVSEYLEEVAGQYNRGLPEIKMGESAFVMPRRVDERVELKTESYELANEWLYGRELLEYREDWKDAKVIHWRAHSARLLAPFYGFVMHADEVADRYYKRLMRDLMHYPEEVYCKASQVITLLQQEDSSGSFSSFHIRRNDFPKAYKVVDIDPSAIYTGNADHLLEHEVIYIATDEKDHSMFNSFEERHTVRYMSDYYEKAGISELNPNLLGMLEQIIASHGRTFTGCWFSTFTAYILRLRGHLNMPRTSTFSYYPPKSTYHHTYHLPENPLWSSEWPFGWEGIDETGVPDALAP